MKLRTFLVAAAATLFGPLAQAQSWQLVWSDEFNGSIGPDWVFETGGGGWGNNELEYYRKENATIENGNLVITAKKEDFGGYHYTSARMKTQGTKAWTYGRMEASIKLPVVQGTWPGWWMLGNNISSVGWPASGEVDIMEQINTSPTVYGSVHWQAANGSQADYSNNINTTPAGYHLYAVEWDPDYIRWFVDGTQYNVIQITNGAGNTQAFQNPFFLLLNMAIGGNWPGFSINDAALPAKMYVDYVRVYQRGVTPVNGPIAGVHTIVSAQDGLAVDNASTNTPGAGAVLWGGNGGSAQKWLFTQNSDTSWTITSQFSGQVLDDPGYSTTNGTQVGQWGGNGGDNQRWWVDVQSDGSYKIWNKYSSLALDSASATANGKPVIQWGWNGGIQQRWLLQ